MKVLAKDLKKGLMKILIQTEEDCWHIYNIVEKGDFISAVTYRSRQESTDRVRTKKEGKERVFLKIKVEDSEFQKFTDRLRIRGTIVEGAEDIGAYHTFSVEPGMSITLEKEWTLYHFGRLAEAVKSHPKIAVVVLDDETATIARIHEYGVEEVANISSHRTGKMYDTPYDEKNYFGQILAKVVDMQLPVAIVGPGFEKERFVAFARDSLKHYVSDTVAHAGMPGIYEAMKRGIVERIMKDNRVAKETCLVEKLMEYIAQDKPVAYGKNEVECAVDAGAVEMMLILNSSARESEDLIRKTENIRASIEVISDWHDAGKKLEALGGVAAFLRYRLT